MIQNELLHSKELGGQRLIVVRYEDIKKNISNEVQLYNYYVCMCIILFTTCHDYNYCTIATAILKTGTVIVLNYLQVFRMLDFLQVDYSPDEVLNRLRYDFSAFKRPKPPRDFDPYTPEQRQTITSTLQSFMKWLTANHHKDAQEWIRDYE